MLPTDEVYYTSTILSGLKVRSQEPVAIPKTQGSAKADGDTKMTHTWTLRTSFPDAWLRSSDPYFTLVRKLGLAGFVVERGDHDGWRDGHNGTLAVPQVRLYVTHMNKHALTVFILKEDNISRFEIVGDGCVTND